MICLRQARSLQRHACVARNKVKKQFNKIKRKEFPWVYDVTKCAAEAAFSDLGTAFSNYFRRKKEGSLPNKTGKRPRKDRKPFGHPRFK